MKMAMMNGTVRDAELTISCGCGRCPFDLRTTGYLTSKEDPMFEGTKCGWHEQIRGRYGYIYLSGHDNKGPILACDIGDRSDSFRERLGWATYVRKFRLSKLDYYANAIGAKRK